MTSELLINILSAVSAAAVIGPIIDLFRKYFSTIHKKEELQEPIAFTNQYTVSLKLGDGTIEELTINPDDEQSIRKFLEALKEEKHG